VPALSIGVALALTGPERVYARQLLDAIQLACEDERASTSLSLVVEDDQADPEAAAGAAARLVAAGVHAVVGPMNSWTCAAAGPILAQAGLTHITPSASNAALTRRGWADFFRMCPNDLTQARALAWVARTLAGVRGVAAVHDGTNFAQPLAAAFVESSAAQGLATGPICEVRADDEASFHAAAEAVAESAVDGVFIGGLEEPCAHAAVSIRRRSAAIFFGTDAIKPTRSLVTDGSADGPYLTSASVDAAQSAPAFHSRFEERFGSHLSIYTVEAYDAVRLIAAAVRRAPKPQDGVGAAIRRLGGHRGLSGDIRFDADGERNAPRLGVYAWDGAAIRFCSWYVPPA
jgi:branched-chain amino acid transport system substrate-binding protein